MPNFASVFKLMEENKEKFLTNLTFPADQAQSRFGYPMVLFTYAIFKNSTKNEKGISCCQMTETIGFMDFLLGKIDQNFLENRRLIGIESEIAKKIRQKILQKIFCDGKNVWEMFQKSFSEKDFGAKTTLFLLQLIAGIFSIIFLFSFLIFAHFGIKKFKKLHDFTKWNFNSAKFKLEPGIDELKVYFFAFYENEPTILNPLKNFEKSPEIWNFKSKRSMHKLIKEIQNENLLPLLGAGRRPGSLEQWGQRPLEQCLVYSRKSVKKSLHFSFKHDGDFLIDESIRFHLAIGIANGLKYLHQKQIVVGQLNSLCTFLDSSWTPKIGNWAEMHQLQVRSLPNAIAAAPVVSTSTTF